MGMLLESVAPVTVTVSPTTIFVAEVVRLLQLIITGFRIGLVTAHELAQL